MGEDSWSSIAPMNEKRSHHAALEVKNGVIYVFCGQGEHEKAINSIEYFSSDSWKTIPIENKFQPRYGPGVVGIKGGERVIILGGVDYNNNLLKDAFMLNTNSNTIELVKEDIGKKVCPGWHPVMVLKK